MRLHSLEIQTLTVAKIKEEGISNIQYILMNVLIYHCTYDNAPVEFRTLFSLS